MNAATGTTGTAQVAQNNHQTVVSALERKEDGVPTWLWIVIAIIVIILIVAALNRNRSMVML